MAAHERTAAPPPASPAERPTVAVALARAIAGAGVELAFTFPGGGSNLAVLDALRAHGVRTVLARGEEGAGLMAATAADISGVPGVLVVGLGPGVASAVNAVAHAWLDRSPLLVIADRYSDADAGTSGHQVLDQRALLAPVTKACLEATPATAEDVIAEALDLALASPRGPVFIETRRDHVRLPAQGEPHAAGPRAPVNEGPAGDVDAAAKIVSDAARPVVLVGDETRHGLDQGLLVALAERLGAPVLASYKGKGAFPETHPLAAGMFTGAEIERPLLDEADVFLAVGLDPVELLARPWTYEATVVALREDGRQDDYLEPRVTLTGPLDETLARLSARLSEPKSEWQPGDAAARASEMRAPLRAPGGPLTSWAVVESVQEALGDARVTVDAGAHMFPVTWFWRSSLPNRFHISNGLATMGHALPAAIGAALAAPDDPVVAFTGDGGFTINAAELETAVRAGVKVIVVVIDDASLTLIRVKQDESGLERANVDFVQSDFARVAAGFGVAGAQAETVEELRTAVAAAAARDGSTVIDVTISGDEYGEIHRLIRSGR